MKTMVKLPNGNWVNPAHVTCVELKRGHDDRVWTDLWVKTHAGYGTTSYSFPGDQRDELAAIINGDKS